MSYLVMECHPGYAVVLDSDGRFFKVANRNYQVGQTVTSVIKMLEPDTPQESRPQSFAKSRMQIFAKSWMRTAAAAAACLFIMVMGARQFLIVPYGSVRMQINPDIQMSLNRLDYVIALEGLNTDGETLIDGYSFRWKSVEQVSDDLADRAIEYGYLTDGGNIHLTVNSSHEKWKAAAESRILLELEVHLGKTITVTAGDARMDEQTPDDDRESDTGNPSHPNKDSAPVSGNGNTSQNVIVIPVGPDAADEAVNDMDEDDDMDDGDDSVEDDDMDDSDDSVEDADDMDDDDDSVEDTDDMDEDDDSVDSADDIDKDDDSVEDADDSNDDDDSVEDADDIDDGDDSDDDSD